MPPPKDEPADHAHALLERLFALLHDCRAEVLQLEVAPTDPEFVSPQAERLLYFALVGAIEAGLVRTAEDALTVLRQASQPLGPMGAEWRREVSAPPGGERYPARWGGDKYPPHRAVRSAAPSGGEKYRPIGRRGVPPHRAVRSIPPRGPVRSFRPTGRRAVPPHGAASAPASPGVEIPGPPSAEST